MPFVLRAIGGQANFRPAPGPKADHRPRAASSAPSHISSGQTPAPAPQGGFPVFLLPVLVASAAMPIYGYIRCQKEIADARAAYAGKTQATASSKK